MVKTLECFGLFYPSVLAQAIWYTAREIDGDAETCASPWKINARVAPEVEALWRRYVAAMR